MKEENINLKIKVYHFDELPAADQTLINMAKDATQRSYSPYSKFQVGAAARLSDGTIVTGSNQENVAYPLGQCAERTTLFYANSQYPTLAIDTLAIAAYTDNQFTSSPITPCGGCRQVMLETENRYKQPMRILLYGTKEVYEINSASFFLPLSFNEIGV